MSTSTGVEMLPLIVGAIEDQTDDEDVDVMVEAAAVDAELAETPESSEKPV